MPTGGPASRDPGKSDRTPAPPERQTVALGLLGATLDAGAGPRRWERWRPSVALCQHETLLIHRFELLCQENNQDLARTVIADIASVAPETEVKLHLLKLDDPWDFEEVYGALHDFARAYPFDPEREDYLLNITTGTHVAQICLFLLAESHRLPARLVQLMPPRVTLGPGSYRVIDLDLSRYDRLASRFQQEQREDLSFLKAGIETRNRAFNAQIEQIERVGLNSKAPMLLTGPTGAGKSQLARRIYQLKRQRRQLAGPFVEVNCATLRGDGAMSALFGHVKGAFTGAVQDRPGLLRRADGGLLFLDEIGELGLDEQAMLLRALEEKLILPVGSDKEVRSDFQLIAGTNRALGLEVRAGRFREDLLARINLWTFRLPGLRDRVEDIEPNLQYELERFAREQQVQVTFNREARQAFLDFAQSPEALWSANFRDFSAAVTRMATLAAGGRITLEVVEGELERLREAWGSPATGGDGLETVLDAETLAGLDRFDRVQLAEVVKVCRGSRTLAEAGRVLFAASRQQRQTVNDSDRLRKYLARFGLDWNNLQEGR